MFYVDNERRDERTEELFLNFRIITHLTFHCRSKRKSTNDAAKHESKEVNDIWRHRLRRDCVDQGQLGLGIDRLK